MVERGSVSRRERGASGKREEIKRRETLGRTPGNWRKTVSSLVLHARFEIFLRIYILMNFLDGMIIFSAIELQIHLFRSLPPNLLFSFRINFQRA